MDPTGQTPASRVGLATLLCEETGLGDAPASEQGCGRAGPTFLSRRNFYETHKAAVAGPRGRRSACPPHVAASLPLGLCLIWLFLYYSVLLRSLESWAF